MLCPLRGCHSSRYSLQQDWSSRGSRPCSKRWLKCSWSVPWSQQASWCRVQLPVPHSSKAAKRCLPRLCRLPQVQRSVLG